MRVTEMRITEEQVEFLRKAKGDTVDESASKKAQIILDHQDGVSVAEISYQMRISTAYIYQILSELRSKCLRDVVYKRKGRPVGR